SDVDKLVVCAVVDEVRVRARLAGLDSAGYHFPAAAIPQPGGVGNYKDQQVARFVVACRKRRGFQTARTFRQRQRRPVSAAPGPRTPGAVDIYDLTKPAVEQHRALT